MNETSTLHEVDINTLVIGAGQAGLATSWWLRERGIPHAVLERSRIGNSWRQQRWNSFRLNTPNRINLLPGDSYEGSEPYGFSPGSQLASYFEDYVERNSLPVEEGVEVSSVEHAGDRFWVTTGETRRSCRNLVLCSGDQNDPRTPSISSELPEDIVQLHTGEYRSPEQLPQGSVLVVGSGQSGVQIAEDLLEAGRSVYLSTSAVGRAPRRYRGKDILEWIERTGLGEQRVEDLQDPNEVHARQVQVSGTRGGHTVSLQQLAREGAVLVGRLTGARDRSLLFADDLLANVAKGDASASNLKAGLDMFIEKAGVDAPPATPDPAEAPFEGMAEMAELRELSLEQKNIRSVIWATGFGPRFDFLSPTLLDSFGRPRNAGGVCETRGLYCVGFMWLRRRISGLVAGANADAEYIASCIATDWQESP